MFPVREKNHNMNIRIEEHFQVDFANTQRLNKSAIPSMQRILNEDYSDNQARRVRSPG